MAPPCDATATAAAAATATTKTSGAAAHELVPAASPEALSGKAPHIAVHARASEEAPASDENAAPSSPTHDALAAPRCEPVAPRAIDARVFEAVKATAPTPSPTPAATPLGEEAGPSAENAPPQEARAPLPGVVTVFTKKACPHCVKTKELLATKPVAVRCVVMDDMGPDVDVEEVRALLRDLTGGRAKTVPQIFFNHAWIEGGNSNLQKLEADGQLDALMRDALALAPDAPAPADLADDLRARLEAAAAAQRARAELAAAVAPNSLSAIAAALGRDLDF